MCSGYKAVIRTWLHTYIHTHKLEDSAKAVCVCYIRSSVTLCTMHRHAAVVLPAHTAPSPTERGATTSSSWKLNLIISKKVTKVSLKSR